jgi:NAD(P)-dependent dehydrogenase (short-subunit alcohol dehydrogenase family)
MKDLAGKVAVVTGGGGGIGKATGTLFAENGMKVVLADMNPEVLEATVSELQERKLEVIGVPTDVADFEAVKNLADVAFSTYGKVHISMNNAGTGGGGSFYDTDMDGWNRAIGVNVQGTLHGILAFLPRMLEQDEEGNILATTSGAGAQGTMYTGPAYAATKMAIISLMESLYGQLRDRDAKIKPGIVFPPLTRSNMGSEMVEEMLQKMGVPAVLGEPEELAQVILEGIKNDTFWINPTRDQDERFFGGRLKPNIDWQDEMVMAKANAMIERTPPDVYLWGGAGGRRQG